MPGKKKTEPVNWEEYNRRIDLFSSAFRKIQEGGKGLSQEEKRVWEESNKSGLDFFTCEECGRYCLMYRDDRLICESCSIRERGGLSPNSS